MDPDEHAYPDCYFDYKRIAFPNGIGGDGDPNFHTDIDIDSIVYQYAERYGYEYTSGARYEYTIRCPHGHDHAAGHGYGSSCYGDAYVYSIVFVFGQ